MSKIRSALVLIARRDIPDDTDLWPQLAGRLERKDARMNPKLKLVWTIVLALIILLVVTGTVYAVSNWLKYIYVPQANTFLPAESTLVIKQPVRQEHDGRTVTVTQGTANDRETTLWLAFSDAARPVDGATLKTPDGQEIKLTNWQYEPNEPGTHGIRVSFAALPIRTTRLELILPEGWQIPLEWVALSARETPVATEQASLPTSVSTAETSCAVSHHVQLCVLSAAQTDGKTVILVGAKPIGGLWTAGSQNGASLLWWDDVTPITLVDAAGRSLPLETADPAPFDGAVAATLTFTGIPAAGGSVKLSIPGFYVHAPLQQSVLVDLGPDPQPGLLTVNADLDVFGQTLRFRTGNMEGDGKTGLRLYLNGEPVSIVNGVEPFMLEMGRPDRVDDLFGTGNLSGGKDLFVELFQGGKKLTGKLLLPVTGASAIIHAPLSFDVPLSSAPPTATPIVADPNTFLPAPTVTPLPFDNYRYSGNPLNFGDLLYTVLSGDNTQLYVYTPAKDQSPRLLATLPGAVAQIHLHADRLGLDYLAGKALVKDEIPYIDSIALYTLRFADPAPRLLHTFAPNPTNWVGTTVRGDWSFDGRYAIFRTAFMVSGGSPWQYAWLDVSSCRAGGDCVLQKFVFQPNFDFSEMQFAPDNYQILLTGSDAGPSGTGQSGIFLLDFDPLKPGNLPVNINANLSFPDVAYEPIWTSQHTIFMPCSDAPASLTAFCFIDPASGKVTAGAAISVGMNGYRLFGGIWLSPSGKQIAAVIFPKNGTRESLLELRLLDLDGHPGTILAESQDLTENLAFSASGQYIAYSFMNGQKLELFDTLGGASTLLSSADPGTLTWLGWVP